MRTNLNSTFRIPHSAFAALAAFALFTTIPCAPAQSVWGSALSFNGVDQYLAMPTNTWFSNDLTIEAWVYERGYSSYSRLVDFGNGAAFDNVVVALTSGTTGRPYFEVDASGVARSLIVPTAIPINQWVHLAVTLQGSNATIYVNGVAVVSTNNMPPPNAVLRTNNYVGRSNWAGNSYANAVFDDLRIWSVARSQSDLQANMTHPLTGAEANLVAYYRFDEGGGVMAYDASPNRRHGTLVNRPVRVPSNWSPVVTLNSPNR